MEVLKFVVLPAVAGAIFSASLIWWASSWVVEGYRQVNAIIRNAN